MTRVFGFLIPAWCLLIAAAFIGVSCGNQAPPYRPAPHQVTIVTATEQILIDRITRDAFIRVDNVWRNDDGFLIVTTIQGDTHPRYLLAPDNEASKELKIRRMVEDFLLKNSPSNQLGTGPEPRGLSH